MGKNAGRITTLGLAVAVPVLSAALTLPATASANPSPTIDGDCAATLQNGKSGKGLSVDAGAPLNAPDRLTVGLDSKAQQADGQQPLFTLPVGDVVRTLGVGDAPAVGELATDGVCPAAQDTVNAVGDTTQNLVGGATGNPPGQTPPGDNPPGGNPPGQTPPGQTPPGSSLDPVVTGPGDQLGDLDSIAGIFTNAAMLPSGLVQAPPVITQVIPGQLPADQVPTVDAKKSGTAQALPAVTPPAKLPMLLAVLALAIVAAALVRAWLRRKPA
ncbi:hypothetical protein [Amycolatopsis sp. FDAARGOS 1241]|uniref:hypothetical protein n=1 Tax=Amycolatopsis sp. FDAARGOS 1241 TaxID=2778070 RepID=UPI0019509E68|nr:hypothetical protein [Amycolatopsis sp. FDAARGOS 1241]QRP46117.1 hypothetical protein I6J71_44965 [Amycolatopsis sp. FDAARGOS 1241]